MITLLSGTNRPLSNTRKVVAELERLYDAMGEPVRVLDLQSLPPEAFAPTTYAAKPEAFAPFAEAVLASSGLHVVTPEYNGGFPGVLKYFIDLLPFPEAFEGRPVAFVGVSAGQYGALRPVEQLSQIFAYRNAHQLPQRVFIPKVYAELDESGRLTNPDLVTRLRHQAEAFRAFVQKVRA